MNQAESVPQLRWWGWGERATPVPSGLLRVLEDELGAAGQVVAPAVPRDAVQLPPAALSDRLRRRLGAAVGTAHVRRDDEDRLRHAAGRSYLDLIALRAGILTEAPDAVLHPASAAEVARVLRVCSEDRCAVVPFGGGTSVVGGVAPRREGFHAVVALASDRLGDAVDLDDRSRLATVPAGMTGPALEAMLGGRGLRLGHYPQSFAYATIGGYAATRSAGQASSGHGRFDDMVRGATVVTPTGTMTLTAAPPDAAGPSLLQLVIGSEGSLGVFTDVTLRVRARPRARHCGAWTFEGFDDGVDALRELAQRGHLPDVIRLADAEETRISFAMAGDSAMTRTALRYLRLRGHRAPCLLILGWEGDGADVGTRTRRAVATLRRHGAVSLGGSPGRAWLRSRFEGPYLRDALLDRALLVETLETAATWTQLAGVRAAVLASLHGSLAADGTPPLVGCHVSHVYVEGASLYFTVLARQLDGDQRGQWLRAKRAATDALLSAGGVLTHHHGVGADHAPWMQAHDGATGIRALVALRGELDPAGVMNPGKLLPPAA